MSSVARRIQKTVTGKLSFKQPWPPLLPLPEQTLLPRRPATVTVGKQHVDSKVLLTTIFGLAATLCPTDVPGMVGVDLETSGLDR